MTQPWKAFEHYVAQKLRQWGFTANRTTSGRQGQEPNVDVDAVWNGIQFAIECKQSTRGKNSYRVQKEWFNKLDKIVEGQGRIPILVFNFYQAKNGQVWCLRGKHFFKLIQAVYEEGKRDALAEQRGFVNG